MFSPLHVPQALSVRNCPRVTDAGVRGLAAARPGLQDLALDDNRAVTAAGISSLAECCPNFAGDPIAHLLLFFFCVKAIISAAARLSLRPSYAQHIIAFQTGWLDRPGCISGGRTFCMSIAAVLTLLS